LIRIAYVFRAFAVVTLMAAALLLAWQPAQARVPSHYAACHQSPDSDGHVGSHPKQAGSHVTTNEPYIQIDDFGCCGLGCSPALTLLGTALKMLVALSDRHDPGLSIALAGFEPPVVRRPPRG
jgi:hypothetical protein